MTPITVNHHQVRMRQMALRRSLGQRSRSVSKGHRNLVNMTAPEPLKGFEPKLAEIFPTMGPLIC